MMVPFITKPGKCFRRAVSYFCYDKKAKTTARIEWIETRNLMTDDPQMVWRIMEYTYQNRSRLKEAAGRGRGGRNVKQPVFSYSLSWHPEQQPTRQEMIGAADRSLEALGLEEHEVMIICHNDEPHPHVHLVVNRIHPLTGMAANMSHSKRKLSGFARRYERESGRVYCPQREENHRKQQQGRKTRYRNPIIAGAWAKSADAKEFVSRLEARGYHIADGGRRLVVIDPYGKVLSPVRHLKGVKARDFMGAMRHAYPEGFPPVSAVKLEVKAMTGLQK